MIKVEVTNARTATIEASATFPDLLAAQAWIDACIANKSWGEYDRWIRTELLTEVQKSKSVDTRPAPTVANPNETESLLSADFSVKIKDSSYAEVREEILTQIRRERNKRLTATDFTQLADAPLDSTQKQAMRDYRQALRDLPETIVDIDAPVVWPVKPEVQ